MEQRSLFDGPEGLLFQAGFLSEEEEEALLVHVRALPYRDFVMHGVVARRKVVHFGFDYGGEQSRGLRETEPLPSWLLPLRARGAALAGQDPGDFRQALVTSYPAGAGIGWHRDAPMFGPTVIGVSLAGACQMRFRRLYRGPRERSIAIPLPPRSAYVLGGPSRSEWQHSVPPVASERFAVTFRTLKVRR
jgi:alkylated DNA repair protein (DNA oxidative demethylase)